MDFVPQVGDTMTQLQVARYSCVFDVCRILLMLKGPVPIQTSSFLVRKGGLEPPTPKGLDPKSSAYANSATFARPWLPARRESRPGQNREVIGEPPGTRTPNPLIKSQLLCQLS